MSAPIFVAERTVLMAGMPLHASVDEIEKFFVHASAASSSSSSVGIPIETYRFLLNKSGRISDEVLVMFFCYDDAKRALLFHGRLMNDERMISVFPVTDELIEQRLPPHVHNSHSMRVRGLPTDITEEGLHKFFHGLNIVGIYFIEKPLQIETEKEKRRARRWIGEGATKPRFTGEAFIKFETAVDAMHAHEFHMKMIGTRYIEVFQSTDADFERARDPSVKLLDKNRQERLKPQTDQGWLGPGWIPTNNFYEMRGYEYDEWGNEIGRLVDYWQPRESGKKEVQEERKRQQDAKKYPIVIRMRGIPFRATRYDIQRWMAPILPYEVEIVFKENGIPSGEARLTFHNYDDALKVMEKNRQYMGDRWIDLHMETGKGIFIKKPKVADGYYHPEGKEMEMLDIAHMAQSSYGPNAGPVPMLPKRFREKQEEPRDTEERKAEVKQKSHEQRTMNESWTRYWKEYQEYKIKYDAYARQMRSRGQPVPPMQPPVQPDGAPPPGMAALLK